MRRQELVVLLLLALVPGYAASGNDAADDDSYVWGLGPALERDLKNKTTKSGAALTVERAVVENWLEIEVGVTRLNKSGQSETGVGVTFKKPFQLSRNAEVMIGVGPQIVRSLDAPERRTSLAIEAVLDFMFWPTESRKFGWYVEPSYSFGLGNNKGERFLGGSTGLLIRWP